MLDAPKSFRCSRLLAATAVVGMLSTPTYADPTSPTPTSAPQRARDGSVAGIVTDSDKKPVAGAEVTVYSRLVPEAGRAVTASDGRFVVKDIAPQGRISLHVRAKGFGTTDSHDYGFSKTKTLQLPGVVLLRTDSFAAGMVVDSQNRPIAGVQINSTVLASPVRTDANGKFWMDGICKRDITITIDDPRPDAGKTKTNYVMGGRSDNRIRLLTASEENAGNKEFFERRLAADNHGDGTPAGKLLYTALAQAKATGRGVFLTFHASWCGPCFMLHEYLHDPQIKPIIDKYFVVQDIDIWERKDHTAWNNPGGEDLYQKYGKKAGVPFWVAIKANGSIGGTGERPGADNMGYPYTLEQRDWFLKSLKTAAPGMTDAEMQTLSLQLAPGI